MKLSSLLFWLNPNLNHEWRAMMKNYYAVLSLFLCVSISVANTNEKTVSSSDVGQIVIKPKFEFTAEERILEQQGEEAVKSKLYNDLFMDNLNASIESLEWKLSKFYLWRANAYFMRGDYESSEIDYRKIVDTSKNGYIEYRIGECLYKQVKYHEALEMFRRAQTAPGAKEDRRTHFLYPYYEGLALIQIKKLDEAKELFDNLKEQFPDRDLSEIYLWFPEREKSQ